MACPHVAGAAALVWSCVPSLTNQQLRQVLENHADPCLPYWFDGIGTGKGRLNLARALQAARQIENTPSLAQLSLSANSVQAGATVQGTVTLTRPAGQGGVSVQLHSSNASLAQCPASLTIPEGQTTGTFTISTSTTGAGSVTISASLGGVARTATLQIVSPYRVQSVSLSPSVVTGGHSATLVVHLTNPAPSGGVQVQLRSSAPAAYAPASVLVPAGQSSVSVRVATTPVTSRVNVNLTASLNDSQASARLTVNPPAPVSLVLTPAAVPGGRPVVATVMLNAEAPAGGLWLRVNNDQPGRVATPRSVYISAGARSVQFTIITYRGRIPVNATITVATEGGSRSATLTVR